MNEKYNIIIVETKKEKDPSNDLFPQIFVLPYLTPINAAKESEILIIKSEDMIIFMSSKK